MHIATITPSNFRPIGENVMIRPLSRNFQAIPGMGTVSIEEKKLTLPDGGDAAIALITDINSDSITTRSTRGTVVGVGARVDEMYRIGSMVLYPDETLRTPRIQGSECVVFHQSDLLGVIETVVIACPGAR